MRGACLVRLEGQRRLGRGDPPPLRLPMTRGCRRQMMGVNRFRQAARVTGNTARQASDVNSATLINVNNVYAKVAGGLHLKHGEVSGNDGGLTAVIPSRVSGPFATRLGNRKAGRTQCEFRRLQCVSRAGIRWFSVVGNRRSAPCNTGSVLMHILRAPQLHLSPSPLNAGVSPCARSILPCRENTAAS